MIGVQTDVVFRPWKGAQYDQGIGGAKTLILGESHYHSCDDDPACAQVSNRHHRHQTATCDVVQYWKTHPHRSPVSYRVPAVFDMPKEEFWNRVAFYNFLQSFAGTGARMRPKREQWQSVQSHRAFQSVLDELLPDRILVLGKETWAHLPSSPETLLRAPVPEPRLPVADIFGRVDEVDKTAYWYAFRPTGAALAMPNRSPFLRGLLCNELGA